MTLHKILEEWVGESKFHGDIDTGIPDVDLAESLKYDGYNQAKAELRAEIPELEKAIVEDVVNWAKKRCEDNIKTFGTDKWNSDLEDLINKLQ